MSFSLNESKEDLMRKLNNAQDVPQTIQIGTSLLNIKIQQELLEQQNLYNEAQLRWSRSLAIGTWALVIATFLLVTFS